MKKRHKKRPHLYVMVRWHKKKPDVISGFFFIS